MNSSSDPVGIRIRELLDLAAAWPQAAGVADAGFAQEYYRQLDADDLAERSAQDMLAAMVVHRGLALQRDPGRPSVRIFNPSLATDGWTSRHTVIQVVNDDMPFLVDSVTMEINRLGLNLHFIAHPILAVLRDAQGRLQQVQARAGAPDAPQESWMHIELDRVADPGQAAALAAGIERVLADVRVAVDDWTPMRARLREAMAELGRAPASLPRAQVEETRAFLEWLADGHFTLLGYRQHDLVEDGGEIALQLVAQSGLGVLRETAQERLSASFAAVPPQARVLARAPLPLVVVAKANTRSTVHRPAYTDYVGVKRYNARGEVIGEHRFIGLFGSKAYSDRVSEIPLLRRKAEAIASRAGLAPGGHLDKALQHVLQTFPRDELFQIPEDDLYDIALGIVSLGERRRLRLFTWRDPYDRFVSCLVYVPRDTYSTDLRVKFQKILMEALQGTSVDFDALLGDAALARIHFSVRTRPGAMPAVHTRSIERQLALAARRWEDELRDALVKACGEAEGLSLFARWGGAFPVAFRERVLPSEAVHDVGRLAALSGQASLSVSLYRPEGSQSRRLGLKVYRLGAPLVLSESLPMLEHMGVRVIAEANYAIGGSAAGSDAISLHDFDLTAPAEADMANEDLGGLFEQAFEAVFSGQVESDDFNRLVLLAGLAAPDIVILRAYAKYLRQIGFAQSQATIASTLAAQPVIARLLVNLFKLRFDPLHHDAEGAKSQLSGIEQALARVSNLTEDRVLRQLLALVQATLRTNFWRTGPGHSGEAGARRPFVSFKLDSAAVPELPLPRPLYEIWVYSPRFEGIHLRGGKVARGGLRWSDRPDDFRTEVLGLVKAQMVKNTVIVPVGSKGGFVLKKGPPPSQREAWMAEGVACYKDYLRGLLDLTDNLVAGKPVPPPLVLRADGDDPYLVVAADKGTATFSDYANAVSLEYGHWLGDAFASGGSVGYDHKAMGITARGAWESVKRHFRELGLDTQTTDFSVVGIGDMSGDVFGNGMLLSRHIRLLAAFDHRHVFIDPSPDPEASFVERERLFALPRSSWADYDTGLLSAGGGVWARSEKSVPISPQARAALGIEAAHLTPSELVSAILRAPVDLLYNGGIGTYVKASSESNADVGDRANDGLRINGGDLRCKVVGEGGNLGFTQRGRVEAARAGVRLYTDAIDNSAGVDTSDHEVNIKILLGIPVAAGRITPDQRNLLLPTMTDEVAALVLRDNYFQTQALSIERRRAPALLDEQTRFIRFLEKASRLHRAVEFLPGDDEIADLASHGRGLAAPELAVLLAYSKMWLYDTVLASDLPEDPWVATALQRYFPQALCAQFGGDIPHHPLKREIIATHVVNSMVNRVGPTFAHRLSEASGASPQQVARAYLAAREVFGCVALWQQIEVLDNRVPDAVQGELILIWRTLVSRAAAWFLRGRRLDQPMETLVLRLQPAIEWMSRSLAARAGASSQAVGWVAAGVPADLAGQVASAEQLVDALDVAEIAEATGRSLSETGAVHSGVGARLGIERLRQQIAVLPTGTHWLNLAKLALGDDLADLQRAIAQRALAGDAAQDADTRIEAWEAANRVAYARARRMLAEMADAPSADLAMLSVALRELRNLI